MWLNRLLLYRALASFVVALGSNRCKEALLQKEDGAKSGNLAPVEWRPFLALPWSARLLGRKTPKKALADERSRGELSRQFGRIVKHFSLR